ncbi:AAA family ATPase [Acinetobacter baumannii]|uniref:AAA family ATPase n=1 Tax=Acinetobacter baumannii TaxID=470 RepID=UPI00044A0A6B|nr:AAA family ATPase [Acinetobacter baumannii]EKU3009696.1 AAA family ATPase [Acinetobacter baumannii]EKU4561688.1 AAA family ATPase [Acinetobacter baumannii]EKV4710248.1 AAA family ATPase [Acinetobacter baumannii]EKV5887160.1 AAA family ATPase [Acinetobacter baumannii]EKV8276814.1 AAA family ATPase [Acinetobacter baumannii]
MEFLTLKINNFLTIGEARLDLANRGLLLVQGENKDNSSADSNGSGKSSIVDALCWCLYGTTARDVTGDLVINKTAKKDCAVELTIHDNGQCYKIARHRKHATHKNALIVLKTDIYGNELPNGNITKGTDKETQELVVDIVGSTLDVFMSSVYAGQEMMPNLPALTDKNLKVLIEEAAGIQVLEQAHTIAKRKLAEVKAKLSNKLTIRDNFATVLATMQSQLAETQAKLKQFDDTKESRARAVLSEALPLKKAIEDIKVQMGNTDINALNAEKQSIETAISKAEDLVNEAKKLTQIRDDLGIKYRITNNNYSSLKTNLNNLATKIRGIDGLVGTPCTQCGKEFCASDLQQARSVQMNQAQVAKQDALKAKAEMEQVKAEFEAAEKNLNDFLQNNSLDVRKLYADKAAVEGAIAAFTSSSSEIDRNLKDIERIKKRAKDVMNEANPFSAMEADQQAKIADYIAKNSAIDQEVQELQALVELHEHAVLIYGPSGVRAHILDTVTPFLNERTEDYLGALTDGNTHAVWSTLTLNSKKELKEKFTIDVRDNTGGESFKGLSGGEKRKVRLATALALQDLVASRATKPISLFIGDEIDDALDKSGLERLMGVLERKARERGTVIVVSHSELRDWIDDVVVVTKENGYSTVSGANLV